MQQDTSVLLEHASEEKNSAIVVREPVDKDEFEAVVSYYYDILLHFISCLLKPSEEEAQADDVLQYVLLQLYLSWPTLKRDRSLKPWLFRVAYNRCIDEVRAKQRRRVISFSRLEYEMGQEEVSPLALVLDSSPLPEEVAEQHELMRGVQNAIEALPPKYRSIVSLRSTQQLDFEEIGQRLMMPSSTVKTYFYRARPLLRAHLKEYFPVHH